MISKILTALVILIAGAGAIYLLLTTGKSVYTILFFVALFVYFGVTHYRGKNKATDM